MFGKVYKLLAGTTPYWVVVYVGPNHVVLREVVHNPNVADEYQIHATTDDVFVAQSVLATNYEVVQDLDMSTDAILFLNNIMGA